MTDKGKLTQEIEQANQAAYERNRAYLRHRKEADLQSEGFYLSDKEKADIYAIEDKYYPFYAEANKAEQEASATRPDIRLFYQGISPERNPDEWQAAQKQASEAIRAWEAIAPQEWKDARARIDSIIEQQVKDEDTVYRAAYKRQFAELGTDPAEIVKHARGRVDRLITDQYKRYKELSETALSMSAYDLVALGEKDWKLDAAETRKRITTALNSLHFRALGDNTSAIDEIKAYIDKAILDSPHIAPEGTPGANVSIIFKERPTAEAIEITRTIYPLTLATPIDKMSKFAFAGLLTEKLQPLAMEGKKSKKEVTTLASVNFSAPQLQGIKGLTHYDEAVYNAICSLYTSGNEYMTVQMIHQAMRGDNEARISPAQAVGIRGSITKFMYGGAYIDATEEVARYKIKGSAIYDSNFINAERVTHNLNGTITECIHLLKTPVLLEYASSKNQIGRAPIKALATPVDKNEETFALQAYLLERIFAMRGTDPQRDIAYSSVYSAVWDKEATSSKEAQSGYIRVKKNRLRKKVFSILDHWTTEGTAKDGGRLIKSYEEYKHGTKKTAQGITINL